MTLEAKQLIFGVGLPAVVALCVAAPFARSEVAEHAWGATCRVLAIALGVLAAHLALIGIEPWPTGTPGRFPAAITAVAAAEVTVAWLSRRWAIAGVRAALAAFLLYALVWPLARNWPGLRAAGIIAMLGGVLLAGPAALDRIASLRAGAAMPLVMWCGTAVAALTLVLSYTARFGQLSGALSATFGSLVLLAWWRPGIRWTGAVSVGAWVLACLLLAGNLTADLLPVRAVLLAAAPFAAAVALIPMGRGRPWIATLLAVIAAATIAGAALALAARSYEPAG